MTIFLSFTNPLTKSQIQTFLSPATSNLKISMGQTLWHLFMNLKPQNTIRDFMKLGWYGVYSRCLYTLNTFDTQVPLAFNPDIIHGGWLGSKHQVGRSDLLLNALYSQLTRYIPWYVYVCKLCVCLCVYSCECYVLVHWVFLTEKYALYKSHPLLSLS